MKIRFYKPDDYHTLKKWYEGHKEPAPIPELIPRTTLILEEDNSPVMSISVIFTNLEYLAFLENYIKKPGYKNDSAIHEFIDYVEAFIKAQNCKMIMCLSYRDELKDRYQQFGYQKTLDNLSSFIKQI